MTSKDSAGADSTTANSNGPRHPAPNELHNISSSINDPSEEQVVVDFKKESSSKLSNIITTIRGSKNDGDNWSADADGVPMVDLKQPEGIVAGYP